DEAGRAHYKKLQEEGAAHPIEEVGKKLRGLMAWVNKPVQDS
ncbi:MAG: ketol-acid reductoisomerase, partial [Pseudonocardiaceae bacterium]